MSEVVRYISFVIFVLVPYLVAECCRRLRWLVAGCDKPIVSRVELADVLARRVTKVLVFNDNYSTTGGQEKPDKYYIEIPVAEFHHEEWFQRLRGDGVEWTNLRCEVRFEQGGEKYRVILRPGDVFRAKGSVPTLESLMHACTHKMKKATLLQSAGEEDVTKRVRKYAGPELDYFKGEGCYVLMRETFPFDRYYGVEDADVVLNIEHVCAVHDRSYGVDDKLGGCGQS